MRLPLRHSPPETDARELRCTHLAALAAAAVGLPLSAAADRVSSGRSRGRHGAALQWHLGLPPHDAAATLDWEDRIEIKLVSIWERPNGEVGCDKIKVCDLAIDPWRKLSSVLWVFADRLTRVVLATRFSTLAGDARARLAAAWGCDPHFDSPRLFVEGREQVDRRAPAYYVASAWLAEERLLPDAGAGLYPFDARWWSQARARTGGRDPLPNIATVASGVQACRRCAGELRFDAALVQHKGWAPARHSIGQGVCDLRDHFAIAPSRLVAPVGIATEEALRVLERLPGADDVRLFDRVPEPGDHGH